MDKHTTSAPLPGRGAGDPHKNTAKCSKVNDRERRRAKRLERRLFKFNVTVDDA